MNVNASITYNASASSSAQGALDDYYTMAALTMNSNQSPGANESIEKNLPASVAAVSIKAAEIDADQGAADGLAASANSGFVVELTASINNQGMISSTIEVSGGPQTLTLVEDAGMKQVVYWEATNSHPLSEASAGKRYVARGAQSGATPMPTNVDNLAEQLTHEQIDTLYGNTLKAINDKFDGKDSLASWSASINEVGVVSADQGVFSSHLRYLCKENEGLGSFNLCVNKGDPMATGDMLMVDQSVEYHVELKDYGNNLVSLAGSLASSSGYDAKIDGVWFVFQQN